MTELPPGWASTTLGDVAQTQLGKMLSAKARTGTGGRPYLRNKNVQWGRIDLDDLLQMDFTDKEFEKFRLDPGDLLVCEGGEVGRAAIWRGAIGGCAYQKALHRVRPRGGVLPEYLLYLLMHYAHARIFERYVTGSTIAHLPQEDLRRLPIPLPPLAEQQRIVAAIEEHLSRLDAADDEVRSGKARLDLLRQSVLGSAVADGRDIALDDLVVGIEAGRSTGGPAPPAQADEWGVIKVSAMTWGEFRPGENKRVAADSVDPRYEIRDGDLLVSRANTTEYVGAAVLVRETPPRLVLSDKSLRLVVRDGVDREWLLYALLAPSTRRQISAVATGTSDSMRNISQEKLRAVRLRVPDVRQQRAIAAEIGRQLAVGTDLEAAADSALRKSAALRRSILVRAMRGELVPQDSNDEPVSVLLERIAAERDASPAATRKRRVRTLA